MSLRAWSKTVFAISIVIGSPSLVLALQSPGAVANTSGVVAGPAPSLERSLSAVIPELVSQPSFQEFLPAVMGEAPQYGKMPGASGVLPPQTIPAAPTVQQPATAGEPTGSLPWKIIIGLTFLTVIPALLLSMTPFVRLLVIFHFLRQALGTQTIPTNQTIIGLSLFLTYFLMQPVAATIYNSAALPYEQGSIDATTAMDRGINPVRQYMLKFTREKDLGLFLDVANEPRPRTPEDLSMRVIVPAYIISELKAGFQVGAVLFLPFLVIDMVVASITTSVGMMQLPPVIISTPLKLLLFVMVDGWHLLIGAIVKSFY